MRLAKAPANRGGFLRAPFYLRRGVCRRCPQGSGLARRGGAGAAALPAIVSPARPHRARGLAFRCLLALVEAPTARGGAAAGREAPKKAGAGGLRPPAPAFCLAGPGARRAPGPPNAAAPRAVGVLPAPYMDAFFARFEPIMQHKIRLCDLQSQLHHLGKGGLPLLGGAFLPGDQAVRNGADGQGVLAGPGGVHV